ncbi:MAG: diacylglycerol kinase family lipid kinase [Candidatus Kapabacteria bacterium]|jgi:YegS/Rv2252/BmrU family lipid kinase|nr:diacylglycerol kinase family lipid kinase [Candidatus Kapabacteria bacterium]
MTAFRRKVIVNPASGNGRTGKTWNDTEAFLKKTLGDADVSFTRAVKDGTILTAQALRDGTYDHIIAVGGDGTLSEVMNGFFVNDRPVNPRAVLSFVPSGTGSDIAKTLGIPTDKKQAIARIAGLLTEGSKQVLDVGKITHKRLDNKNFTGYFLNVASFGMSGNVVRHINRASFLKNFGGKAAFYAASMLALGQYRNTPVHIRIEQGNTTVFEERMNTRLVAVANGRWFGGGMLIAPNAAPNDGLFDIVLIENLGACETAIKFQKIYSGSHLSEKSVRVVRGTRLTAMTDETVWIDCDGEFPGKLPLTMEILPALLPFV